jgi:hypothetical protein
LIKQSHYSGRAERRKDDSLHHESREARDLSTEGGLCMRQIQILEMTPLARGTNVFLIARREKLLRAAVDDIRREAMYLSIFRIEPGCAGFGAILFPAASR